MEYKSFMIEVGLHGNTMDYDYKTHSMLATSNTWFKSIWELVWYFNIGLHVNEAFQLKAVHRVIYLWCLNSCALDILVNLIWSLWISCACIKKLSTSRVLFYVMEKQLRQKCWLTNLEILTFINSPPSIPHQLIYIFGNQHYAREAPTFTYSQSSHKNISVPHITTPFVCLITLELFFIIISCKVIRCTTRSIHRLQIQLIAGPDWDNIQLYNREEWPIQLPSVCKHYSFSTGTGSLTLLSNGVHIFMTNLWLWTCD
jgi:hypothetical protein